jgi:hypothetical protein
MNMYSRRINRFPSPHVSQNKPITIHTDKITHFDLRKMEAIGINPHPFWIDGITKTDMSGGSFPETKFSKETEGTGHVFETPGAFGERGGEGGDQGHADCSGAVADREGVHWTGGGNGGGTVGGFEGRGGI